MSYTNSITSKGQITLPKEYRDKLGLDKIRRAHIRLSRNNEIILSLPKSEAELRELINSSSQRDGLSLSDYDRERGEKLAIKYGFR